MQSDQWCEVTTSDIYLHEGGHVAGLYAETTVWITIGGRIETLNVVADLNKDIFFGLFKIARQIFRG